MNDDQEPDFWPDILDVDTNIKGPARILKTQGAALGRRTKGLVEGQVETRFEFVDWAGTPSEMVVHSFYLAAPVIGYRRRLLRVAHLPEELYPVYMKPDVETSYGNPNYAEEIFEAALRQVFSSQKVLSIIQTLVMQSG